MNSRNLTFMAGNWGALADWSRSQRAKRGWTQRDLAAAAGVSLKTVTDLESGRDRSRFNKLPDIEQAFDVEPGTARRIVFEGGPPSRGEDQDVILPSAEVGRHQVRELHRAIVNADRPAEWKVERLDRLARFLEELGEWEDFIAEIRALPGVDAERAPDSEQDPLYGEERRR